MDVLTVLTKLLTSNCLSNMFIIILILVQGILSETIIDRQIEVRDQKRTASKNKKQINDAIYKRQRNKSFTGQFDSEAMYTFVERKVAQVVERPRNDDIRSTKPNEFKVIENDSRVFKTFLDLALFLTKNEAYIAPSEYVMGSKVVNLEEPRPGMIFAVTQKDIKSATEYDVGNDNLDNDDETNIDIDLDLLDDGGNPLLFEDSNIQPDATLEDSPVLPKNQPYAYYALTDLVEDELGLVYSHHPDYAYSPADMSPMTKESYCSRTKENKPPESIYKTEKTIITDIKKTVKKVFFPQSQSLSWKIWTPYKKIHSSLNTRSNTNGQTADTLALPEPHTLKSPASTSSQHWISHLLLNNPFRYFFKSKVPSHEKYPVTLPFQDDSSNFHTPKKQQESCSYEKMGTSAFAGGSHGEIWRGRMLCGGISEGDSSTKTDQQQSKDNNNKPDCNIFEDLILKRLKIKEKGTWLLEAGLREVYFGEFIKENFMGASSSLSPNFTTYVDHFFRETEDRESGNIDVELWLVFRYFGPSLRSFIYSPVNKGTFIMYEPSPTWLWLRNDAAGKFSSSTSVVHVTENTQGRIPSTPFQAASKNQGKEILRELLRQILGSVALLHERQIVHRDLKPSNILCQFNGMSDTKKIEIDLNTLQCAVADFSSAVDDFTLDNLYSDGPSAKEQTNEYAPPEVMFGDSWVPFDLGNPQSYDSWSIGIIVLEILLGSPNVFSVDQRTRAVLTHRMENQGASEIEIKKALYLAALSQFCIYTPTQTGEKRWPVRPGDPLHEVSIVRPTCTMDDFKNALRARDPLGIGYDNISDQLFDLIWKLLAWDPGARIKPVDALLHCYFLGCKDQDIVSAHVVEPKLTQPLKTAEEFACPKCGRKFNEWTSCHTHTNSRKHGKFCDYNRDFLPPCLNAHSMLPAHPTSGYCDIQGRRNYIEDFHSIVLDPSYQFYGVFDGHNGNLASKYAASSLHSSIIRRMSSLPYDIHKNVTEWKESVEKEVTESFTELHNNFRKAASKSSFKPTDSSGTTATMLYVTKEAIVIASVGDSRATISRNATFRREDDQSIGGIQLTHDHTPADPSERERIERLGGFVQNGGGIPRVNGILAVSRSVGDLVPELIPVLSQTPNVIVMARKEIRSLCQLEGWGLNDTEVNEDSFRTDGTPTMPCFIILASDGLWDVMSNDEAVFMTAEVLRHYDAGEGTRSEEGGAFQEAAEILVHEAFVRGSTDNIGVCVVAIT